METIDRAHTPINHPAPRALIIDCDRFELATLSDALRVNGVDVVAIAHESRTALELYKATRPDVVIVSFQGCDDSVINITQVFRGSNHKVGLVLLSPSPDLRLFGFSEEDLPAGTQIVQTSALRELDQLKVAIEASLETGVVTAWTFNHLDLGLQSLTDVQIETLRMLAQGMSNGDIAKKRYVSEKSVEQTIGRIASHLRVTHEQGKNQRVVLAAEFFKWIGAPRAHSYR